MLSEGDFLPQTERLLLHLAKRPPQGPFMSLGEIARLLGSKFEGHA